MALRFSKQQFSDFETNARDQWLLAAADTLFATYETTYAAMDVTAHDLRPVVRRSADWGVGHGIVSKADVTRLCFVTAVLGDRFWQDPRVGRLLDVAMPQTLHASRRAQSIVRETKGWLGTLWSGDDLAGFATRLGAALTVGRAVSTDSLQGVLPGHWQLFTDSENEELIGWLHRSAYNIFGDRPAQQMAFCACALVHGTGWLDDPQCAAVARAVHEVEDPEELAAALQDIYAQAVA